MKPFRIRPYRAIGGFLLIYEGFISYWYPDIASAMDFVHGGVKPDAKLEVLRAI